MFLFYLLCVGLPCRSIFCQIWLCEEAQCVYLCRHLGSPSIMIIFYWACSHPRPLWVSPTTSPMRLGVSPAATPSPMGVFNQRFEALFPCTRALGWEVCLASRLRLSGFIYGRMWGCRVVPTAQPAQFSASLSPAFSIYLFANVGPQGLLVVRLPAQFVPHSASLGPTTATRVLSTQAACLCPSYQSG